jgi:hypothetical protein
MKLSQQAYSLTLKRAITEEVQKMLIQNGLKSLAQVFLARGSNNTNIWQGVALPPSCPVLLYP